MSLEGRDLGPYRISRLLGRGGSAEVYRAFHRGLGRDVALKVLGRQGWTDSKTLLRFRREGRILSQLRHPGILTVYDADSIDDVHYLAMELREDPTLEDLLVRTEEAGRPPSPTRAVKIVLSLLDTLEVVHTAGIVHRDIKPSNVFIASDDRVIVSDFGIARPQITVEPLTTVAAVLGTLAYMAPEQLDGRPVDARTDLYSTGLVLCRAACGALPFADDAIGIVRCKVLGSPIQPPRSLSGELPGAIAEVIVRACQATPSDRYQSVPEFSGALTAACEHVSAGHTRWPEAESGSTPRRSRPGGIGRPIPLPAATPPDLGRRQRALAASGLVTVVALLGGLWSMSGSVPPARTPARVQGPSAVATAEGRPVPAGACPGRRPAPGSRADGFARVLGEMARLWPGLAPTDLDCLVLDGLGTSLDGKAPAESFLVLVGARLGRSVPRPLLDALFGQPGRLVRQMVGWLGGQGPSGADRGPFDVSLHDMLVLWVGSVRRAVEDMGQLRRGDPGVAPSAGEIKHLVLYLCATQPGFGRSEGGRAIAILAPLAASDPWTGPAEPLRVRAAAVSVDRLIAAHFQRWRPAGPPGAIPPTR